MIEGKRRRGQQRIRWLDSMTSTVDMNLCKLQKTVIYEYFVAFIFLSDKIALEFT